MRAITRALGHIEIQSRKQAESTKAKTDERDRRGRVSQEDSRGGRKQKKLRLSVGNCPGQWKESLPANEREQPSPQQVVLKPQRSHTGKVQTLTSNTR
jgi:hypothetical protein